MTDKSYWYNETDIQYIANGLIKEHNVTPALGTSENRTLKELLLTPQLNTRHYS